MLERQRLREQMKAILTGRTGAGDKVTSSKVTSWDADDLPAINIVTPQERNSGMAASHIPAFDTVLTLNIEISVAVTDGWDNALDEICEQVENLTLKNPDFIKEFTEISNYSTALSYTEGETPIATAIMVYELNYKTIFEPNLNATPFKAVHVTLPVAPDMVVADKIQAHFELEGD